MTSTKSPITSDQAREIKKQHTTPCEDCPWRRDSIKTWLGGSAFVPGQLATADEWLRIAHGDGFVGCHTRRLPIIDNTTPNERTVPEHLTSRSPGELRSAGAAFLFPGEAQCAGVATFRANVCKSPRDSSILVLKPDRITVFANSEEFRAHHSEAPRKPTREEKRAAAQAEYVRISDTATKGAGQTPYIQKKLAKLRATVEKLGGFK